MEQTRIYRFNNSTVTVGFGDITEAKTEVIVSSDDFGVRMRPNPNGNSLSYTIRQKGGDEIMYDAQKKTPANLGDVVVSTAGKLNYKYIFHCITIESDAVKGIEGDLSELSKTIVEKSVERCFQLMPLLNIKSIAFPAVGAGFAHLPLDGVSKTMAQAMAKHLSHTSKAYHVEVCLFSSHEDRAFRFLSFFEDFAAEQLALKKKEEQHSLENENEINENMKSVHVDIKKLRKDMQKDIFISYSHQDKDTALLICKYLDKEGLQYWIDSEGIFVGENYMAAIESGIKHCKMLIYLSSKNANSSKYVQKEVKYAIEKEKQVFPVRLDNTEYPEGFELDLIYVQSVDASTNFPNAMKQLIIGIRHYMDQMKVQTNQKLD